MSSDALRKFADELKSIREEKDVTLQFISHRTKIDINFLKKIEDGDFEVLPELYIRAFLKEYLNIVDANTDEMMKKFDLAKQGLTEENIAPESENIPSNDINTTQPKENTPKEFTTPLKGIVDKLKVQYNNVYYYLGAAGVVVLFIVLIYFLFIREYSPEIVNETPFDELVENNSRFEIDDSTRIAPVKKIVSDSLQLSVSAVGRVWVKVLSDNKEVFQSMLQENQTLSYRASKEFRVVVGNAALAKISFNNRSIGSLGSAGEIKNFTLTADTIKSYLITIPSKNEQTSAESN